MKKGFCLLLAIGLLASAPALADDDLTNRPIADGVVAAVAFTDVAAPYAGTLASFTIESGDAVTQGDALFSYLTDDVYATESGVVQAVFIKPGDDAAAVTARYGAVIGIEPDAGYVVTASTTGAASDNENKVLHLGETLYFKTTGSDGDEGSGRVTQVSGKQYSVDVETGAFNLNAAVTLYRDGGYASKSCVGKGTVTRRDPLLVAGAGRVTKVYVSQGDPVQKGDRLASFVGADASPDAYADTVASPVTGVVKAVQVAAGQQVWKGEVLCRIDRTEAIEVVADVDEVDLGALKVGDALPVTLDMDENTVITGTVTQISALGITKQNAAYFTVHARIPAGSAPLGASASLYLPPDE
jgi:biotin carboxyl carrier protein